MEIYKKQRLRKLVIQIELIYDIVTRIYANKE